MAVPPINHGNMCVPHSICTQTEDIVSCGNPSFAREYVPAKTFLPKAVFEMYFKQFYLGCLAHASYLIGSDGEAVVVDPQRDVDQYLDEAAAHNLKIKYVIETHLHADFVSGHRELAARSRAQIVFGEQAKATIPHHAVRNGDELMIGQVKLRVLETPGHTPESIC